MVADVDAFPEAPSRGRRAGLQVGVVCEAPGPAAELLSCLRQEGVRFAPADQTDAPDALVLDLVEADRRQAEATARSYANAAPPVIAAISWEHLHSPDLSIAANDVIVVPWRVGELALRVRRQIERAGPADEPGVIRSGDLVIDSNRYDIFLAGKPVPLTFKEYELLKLLASNPGRVYTREALLEQVWGYHYFGGTRTVDVHVRRLRSKIEDATHTFIDTVWNVGYRFHS